MPESTEPIEPSNPPDPLDDVAAPWPAVQKFRHRYRTHILLFALTFITTTLRDVLGLLFELIPYGLVHPLQFQLMLLKVLHLITPRGLADGLWYSVPLLTILSAHEFGHYFLCRAYDVDATLPYFIPAPLPLTGTLGAVIRIRQAFPSKRALFDIDRK